MDIPLPVHITVVEGIGYCLVSLYTDIFSLA